METDHTCTKFDQLNTCVECGAPKNEHKQARFSGGAGVKRQALSDEDYRRQLKKLGAHK